MPSPLPPNPSNRSRPLIGDRPSAQTPEAVEDTAAPDASADAENPQQTEEHSPVEDTAAAKTPKPWKGVSHGS